jgi:hypothetical protein
MTMKISGTQKRATLTVNGVRCGITVQAGPWVSGVNSDLIKIRPKKYSFPSEVIDALSVENNSDSRSDYFERDCVRLLPGHPLYQMAKAAVA